MPMQKRLITYVTTQQTYEYVLGMRRETRKSYIKDGDTTIDKDVNKGLGQESLSTKA